MNREASAVLKAPKGCGVCRKGFDKAAWAAIFKEACEAFNFDSMGLVCVASSGRAWFQVRGDKTPYSILLSDAELNMFHI